LVTWRLEFSKAAAKDVSKLAAAGLKPKAQELLDVLRHNPWQNPPPYEKLVGELAGAYSRRINRQHRLVYRVNEDSQVVDILRMWTHYE
jgi:toxin YoeB